MNVLTLPLSPDALARLERREAERADMLRRARIAELAANATVKPPRQATPRTQPPRWRHLLDFGPEWAL